MVMDSDMETQITKLLDSRGIEYRVLIHDKAVFTCEEAAKERKVLLDDMVKCILVVDKKKNYFLACVTADNNLDTFKVRKLVDCSRLSFASKEEIEKVLGYRLGAISPLLLKTEVPVIFDNQIKGKSRVNMSAGDPKAGIELASEDLVRLVKPRFGDIVK